MGFGEQNFLAQSHQNFGKITRHLVKWTFSLFLLLILPTFYNHEDHEGVVNQVNHQVWGAQAAYLMSQTTQNYFPMPLVTENPDNIASSRIIQTEYGKLRGLLVRSKGELSRDVEAYLGISYASPPIGSLRYMPPLTPSFWDGVKLANKFSPVCPQILPDLPQGVNVSLPYYEKILRLLPYLANQSEDCLYLNLYVPLNYRRKDQGDVARIPIIVILEGESFEWGSGSLVDGTALASLANLLVVTLNHRLGFLGYLKTGSGTSGNFALLDVIAALNWVRENGGAFGGDVQKVTLLGSQAGSALANFLMLAPLAKELFHRVILLSGSSLSPWATSGHNSEPIQKITELLGCGSIQPIMNQQQQHQHQHAKGQSHQNEQNFEQKEKISILVSGESQSQSQDKDKDIGPCLRAIPLEVLQSTFSNLDLNFSSQTYSHCRLCPLYDNTVVRDPQFMESAMRKDVKFPQIPLMIGLAQIEFQNSEILDEPLDQERFDRLLRTLVYNTYDWHQNEIFCILRTEYEADPEIPDHHQELPYHPYRDREVDPSVDSSRLSRALGQLLTDGLTAMPIVKVAKLHSNPNGDRTYFLHWTYGGNPNNANANTDSSAGAGNAGHFAVGSELLAFALGGPFLAPPPKFSGRDARNPNKRSRGESTVPIFDELPNWDFYEPLNQKYLEIAGGESNFEFRIRERFRAHKSSIWSNLLPQINQAGFGSSSSSDTIGSTGSTVSLEHHIFQSSSSNDQDSAENEQNQVQILNSANPELEIELFEGNVREYPKLPHIYPSSNEKDSLNISTTTNGNSTTYTTTTESRNQFKNTTTTTSSTTTTQKMPYHIDSTGFDGKKLINNNISRKSTSSSVDSSAAAVIPTVECRVPAPVNEQQKTEQKQTEKIDSKTLADDDDDEDKDEFIYQLGIIYQSHGLAMGISIGIAATLLLLNFIILIKILRQRRGIVLPSETSRVECQRHRKSKSKNSDPQNQKYSHKNEKKRSKKSSRTSSNINGPGGPNNDGIYFCEIHSRNQSPFHFLKPDDVENPNGEDEDSNNSSLNLAEESLAILADPRCAEFLTDSIILRKQMEMDEQRTKNRKTTVYNDEIYV